MISDQPLLLSTTVLNDVGKFHVHIRPTFSCRVSADMCLGTFQFSAISCSAFLGITTGT